MSLSNRQKLDKMIEIYDYMYYKGKVDPRKMQKEFNEVGDIINFWKNPFHCYSCGVYHKREMSCPYKFRTCNRCGSEEHTQYVCNDVNYINNRLYYCGCNVKLVKHQRGAHQSIIGTHCCECLEPCKFTEMEINDWNGKAKCNNCKRNDEREKQKKRDITPPMSPNPKKGKNVRFEDEEKSNEPLEQMDIDPKESQENNWNINSEELRENKWLGGWDNKNKESNELEVSNRLDKVLQSKFYEYCTCKYTLRTVNGYNNGGSRNNKAEKVPSVKARDAEGIYDKQNYFCKVKNNCPFHNQDICLCYTTIAEVCGKHGFHHIRKMTTGDCYQCYTDGTIERLRENHFAGSCPKCNERGGHSHYKCLLHKEWLDIGKKNCEKCERDDEQNLLDTMEKLLAKGYLAEILYKRSLAYKDCVDSKITEINAQPYDPENGLEGGRDYWKIRCESRIPQNDKDAMQIQMDKLKRELEDCKRQREEQEIMHKVIIEAKDKEIDILKEIFEGLESTGKDKEKRIQELNNTIAQQNMKIEETSSNNQQLWETVNQCNITIDQLATRNLELFLTIDSTNAGIEEIARESYSCSNSPILGPIRDQTYLVENIMKLRIMKEKVRQMDSLNFDDLKFKADTYDQMKEMYEQTYEEEQRKLINLSDKVHNFTNEAEDLDEEYAEQLRGLADTLLNLEEYEMMDY